MRHGAVPGAYGRVTCSLHFLLAFATPWLNLGTVGAQRMMCAQRFGVATCWHPSSLFLFLEILHPYCRASLLAFCAQAIPLFSTL